MSTRVTTQKRKYYTNRHSTPVSDCWVQRGQDATIKLSAYDYTIYGSLMGKVTFVSADTFEDERS